MLWHWWKDTKALVTGNSELLSMEKFRISSETSLFSGRQQSDVLDPKKDLLYINDISTDINSERFTIIKLGRKRKHGGGSGKGGSEE